MKRMVSVIISVLLCAASIAGATGQYYAAAVGNPPDPRTFAFRTWIFQYLNHCLADVPIPRGTTYFLDAGTTTAAGATPSDSNDGLDGMGFNLSAATYNAGTQTLTKTGGFTTYYGNGTTTLLWHPGDLIYLATGTGSSFVAGLYTIASVTDANDIVLSTIARPTESALAAPTSGNWTAVTSSNGPWLSLTNPNTKTSKTSGALTNVNARFRFRRDKIWYLTDTANTKGTYATGDNWDISYVSNVTVDSYGAGAKPLWTHFCKTANWITSGWVQTLTGVTYPNVWYQNAPASFVFLRNALNPMRNPMMSIHSQGSDSANLVLCNATPGSFCTVLSGSLPGGTGSTVTLVMNPGAAVGGGTVAPNSNYYDYNTATTNNNGTNNAGKALYVIDADNIRISNIREEGACQQQGNTGYGYGMLLEANQDSSGNPYEVLGTDLEVYFSGYHALASFVGDNTNGGTGGGIVTLVRCKAGYTSYSTTGETVFITFGLGAEYAAGATIQAGGTSYALNDIVTLSGGTKTTAATFQVTGVSGGIVSAVTVVNKGNYTVVPSNPISVTGGAGSGLTLNATWTGPVSGENMLYKCDAPYGTLPDDAWVIAGQRIGLNSAHGTGFYQHTGTVDSDFSLAIRWGCKMGSANLWPPTGSGGFTVPPVAMPAPASATPAAITAALMSIRGFIVDEEQRGFQPGTNGVPLSTVNNAVINCTSEIMPDEIGSGLFGFTGGAAWNNILRMDGALQQTASGKNSPAAFAGVFNNYANAIVFNNIFEVDECYLNPSGYCYLGPLTNILSQNNVFQGSENNNLVYNYKFGSFPYGVGLQNGSTYLSNNAYADISVTTGTNGYDQDPSPVSLYNPIPPGPLPSDSPLLAAGLNAGRQYDKDWNAVGSEYDIGPSVSAASIIADGGTGGGGSHRVINNGN